MNKAVIFDYISQLDAEMKSMLESNPFRDLIVAEILNSATVIIRELDRSSFDDEETARKMIRMRIEKFYEPRNITKVVSRYWNDELRYGLTHVNPTKENLLKFRSSVDITKAEVIEQKHALMHCVEQYKFHLPTTISKNTMATKTNWIYIGLALLGLILVFLYVLNGRYIRVDDEVIFDKWTQKSTYIVPQ